MIRCWWFADTSFKSSWQWKKKKNYSGLILPFWWLQLYRWGCPLLYRLSHRLLKISSLLWKWYSFLWWLWWGWWWWWWWCWWWWWWWREQLSFEWEEKNKEVISLGTRRSVHQLSVLMMMMMKAIMVMIIKMMLMTLIMMTLVIIIIIIIRSYQFGPHAYVPVHQLSALIMMMMKIMMMMMTVMKWW